MSRIIIIKFIFIIISINATIYSEINYIPLSKARSTVWEADSIFLGASMKVADSTANVIVFKRKNFPQALGALYFMIPGHGDSSRLVFHNIKENYPGETDTVVLGKYPKNTQITFMYVLIDTSSFYSQSKNKKLYTGQNRDSIDIFISEMGGHRGKRWAIVGSIGLDKCEVGFSSIRPGDYSDIRFHVTNVNIVK